MESLEYADTIYDQPTKKPSYSLNGSFGASPLDFINRSLHLLSDALRVAVTITYNRLPKYLQKTFYVTNLVSVTTNERIHFQKSFGDPSLTVSGGDVKMLLKNLRSHWKMYSKKMNMYEDAFEDITGFLLHDIVESGIEAFHINHIEDGLQQNTIPLNKMVYSHEVAKDCIEATWELVAAIHDAKYYQAVSKQMHSIKTRLEELVLVIQDFQEIHHIIELDNCNDTTRKEVIQVFDSGESSPTLSPRVSPEDTDIITTSVNNNVQLSDKKGNDSAYGSPDSLASQMENLAIKDTSCENKENLSTDQTKDVKSSCVGVVEHMSTPVLKNKSLEKVTRSNRKPLSMSPILNVNHSKSEAMEGSFVIL